MIRNNYWLVYWISNAITKKIICKALRNWKCEVLSISSSISANTSCWHVIHRTSGFSTERKIPKMSFFHFNIQLVNTFYSSHIFISTRNTLLITLKTSSHVFVSNKFHFILLYFFQLRIILQNKNHNVKKSSFSSGNLLHTELIYECYSGYKVKQWWGQLQKSWHPGEETLFTNPKPFSSNMLSRKCHPSSIKSLVGQKLGSFDFVPRTDRD